MVPKDLTIEECALQLHDCAVREKYPGYICVGIGDVVGAGSSLYIYLEDPTKLKSIDTPTMFGGFPVVIKKCGKPMPA